MSLRHIALNPWLVGCCVLVLAAFWPISYLASPRWEILVVNNEGQPLDGATVRLVYQNYSVERDSHEITLQTDEGGHVLFPSQHRRASLAQRLFYTAASAMAGVHASFGPHASVFTFGNGYEGDALRGKYVMDWQGLPESLQSTIEVKTQ